MAEEGRDHEGQGRAEGEADADADDGDQHDLREVEQHHLPARRAEALQGGDGGALAVDEAAHRIGDADAAHEQGGQADEGQELGEALDVAGKARIGIEPRADVPAGLRQEAVRLRLDLRQPLLGRERAAAG